MNIKDFETFYKEQKAKIYYYCLKKTRNGEEAEDLCQSAFVVLLEKVRLFESSEKVLHWMYNVVNKLNCNLYRKKGTELKIKEELKHEQI